MGLYNMWCFVTGFFHLASVFKVHPHCNVSVFLQESMVPHFCLFTHGLMVLGLFLLFGWYEL